MSEGEDDKVEVKVVVESKDSASKVILISLTLVLLGILIAVVSSGGVEELLPKRADDGGGNCGDGIDNDNGGKADAEDPDCYSNPKLWEGYDPSLTEDQPDNDV
tara:strand:- start:362 stop:673 length:312 start_codon:yes stop_codon:yes gene_type:complete